MTGTMRKRKANVWEITASLGMDQNGIRRRRSRTIHGTKTTAQKELRKLVEEAERDRSRRGVWTVGAWLRTWHREVVQRDCRVKTQERYRGIIDQHLTPNLGQIDLVELSPRHVEDLYQNLLAEGMGGRTVRLVHCVLSGACKHALRRDLVDRNVASLVSPPTFNKRQIVPPEIETVKALLALAEAEGHTLFPFLFTLTYTGMRKGEAWGLKWRHVDLDEGLINVVEAVVRTQHHGQVWNPPKTEKGIREIDLPEVAIDFLTCHKEQQGQNVGPDDLVFPGPNGEMMPETTMMRQLKKLGERVGAPKITFHAFRHFHASVCLEDDENALATSRRLGHGSITTTIDEYGHLMKGRRKSIASSFARAMEPPPEFPPDGNPSQSG